MRRILIAAGFLLVILASVIVIWFAVLKPKNQEKPATPPALAISKHSDSFNQSVENLMNEYYALTEAFVNWDSASVNNRSKGLSEKLNSVDLNELKKDTSGILETAEVFLNNAKNDAQTIQQEPDITNKRHALNSLSDNLFNFLRVVKHDRSKLYLQECPMAFNDEDPGMWLSKTPEIRNPYLGLHHPRYGKGMINCGETKDTLNYTAAQ